MQPRILLQTCGLLLYHMEDSPVRQLRDEKEVGGEGETVALSEDFTVCFCCEPKGKKQLMKGHEHSTGYWLL